MPLALSTEQYVIATGQEPVYHHHRCRKAIYMPTSENSLKTGVGIFRRSILLCEQYDMKITLGRLL
jgi:hypothetical protein